MKELQLINKLCNLNDKFKTIEAKSVQYASTPSEQYLVVRLDGIGLSKKYLKNAVINKRFQKVMMKAIQKTYYVLHRKSPSNAQQLFLAIIMASDEVSFVLNTYGNYFDDKLFKIVTTIASTFSTLFTKEGSQSDANNSITGSFDGRPLILKNQQEVNEYIAYRSAIYNRNTMAKILRLKGVADSELYSDQNNNNLDYYSIKFKQLNLTMNDINSGCSVFIPCNKDDKILKQFSNKSLDKHISTCSKKLSNFENWLHETNNK